MILLYMTYSGHEFMSQINQKEVLKMIIRIAFLITIFVMLYIVAFINNRHYRENDDILFVSRSQWKGIFLLMLLILIAILKS